MSTEPVYATSLETAKEGETVLRLGGGHRKLEVITRTTPTQIWIRGLSFNRKGKERGSTGWYDYIRATSEEEESKVQARKIADELRADLVRRLSCLGSKDFSNEQIEEILKFAESFNA